MPTTLGGKKIVTKSSGHKAMCLPAVSLFPPQPAPVPTPIPFVVQSSDGKKNLKKCLKVNDAEVVVKESTFAVQSPGNTGSQTTGADLVSHVEVKEAAADEGDSRVCIDSQPIATTTHRVRANMPTGVSSMHQATGFWVEGGGMGTGPGIKSASGAGAGNADSPADALNLADPVAVASGSVVDRARDLSLPGALPIGVDRHYSSARNGERTSLGRGGWRLSLESSLAVDEEDPGLLAYRPGDGRTIWFSTLEDGGETFHRRERLHLKRRRDVYEVTSMADHRTYVLRPLEKGRGPALLHQIRDGHGNTVEVTYEAGRLASVVGSAGRELHVHWQEGAISRIELVARGEVVRWVDYAYTHTLELAAAIDATSAKERYFYDVERRLVKKINADGVAFHYEYDDEGRCVRTRGDGGLHEVRFTYDAEAKTTTTTGAILRRYTCDDDGFVIKEETAAGVVLREVEYDADHYALVVRGGGQELKYTYDDQGNLVEAVDPGGNVTRWRFAGGFPRERTDFWVDESHPPLHWSFDWNSAGQLVSVTFPTGAQRRLTYDAAGRLTDDNLDGQPLAHFDFDADGNLVRETDARGAITERTYDALGRTIGSRDATTGAWVRTKYDARSQPIEIQRSNGSTSRRKYSPGALLTEYDDGLGRISRIEYGGTGVPVRYHTYDGRVWRCEYDRQERVRKVINPREETWEFVFDRAGRISEMKTFDERTIRYAYDDAGRVARIVWPDGGWREFAYDALGFPIEDRTDDSTIVYERDSRGFMKKATLSDDRGTVEIAFEHDSLGRIVVERQGAFAIHLEYDTHNRVTKRVLPNGATTVYRWDSSGYLAGVDHDGRQVSFARNALGAIERIHAHRGAVDVHRTYDPELLVTGESISRPGTSGAPELLGRRAYAYDAFTRTVGIDDARWGITRYVYDAAGRLADVGGDRVRAHYDYDATGSLRGVVGPETDPNRLVPWLISTGNVLEQSDRARYEYDERHRRIKRIEGEGEAARVTTYEWDGRDRLRVVTLPDGKSVLFSYDAFGRRTKKTAILAPVTDDMVGKIFDDPKADVPTRTTEYFWDNDALAIQRIEQDTPRGRAGVSTSFVHHPTTLLPILHLHDEEGAFTYVTDRVGVPHTLLDEHGEVAWSAVSTPWGALSEVTPNDERAKKIAPPFRLLGHVIDEETGLSCTKFRYFDTEVARWLSPDPLGIAGGENLFAFDGAPTEKVDPLGLACYLLNDYDAATFANSNYRAIVLQQDTTMYRAGVATEKNGRFYDYQPAPSVGFVRSDMAVLPQWPNRPDGSPGGQSPIDSNFQATVQAGTVVYVGPIAPQRPIDASGNSTPLYNPNSDPHPGGANQVLIPWGVPRDGSGGTGPAGGVVTNPTPQALPQNIITP